MGNFVLIGGSHGIGLEVAKILTTEGHHVHVFSRTSGELSQLAGVTHYTHDVLLGAVDSALIEGGIDGLVYLPGSIQLKPFHRTSTKDFTEDFRINFLGAVESVQAFLPKLKENRGSVVLMSTVAVSVGMPFHASISAAKGAIEGFAKSIAAELAPNVRVNVVAPALTDTPLAEKFLSTPEKKEASSKMYPLGRYGNVNDVAEAIVYLLSSKSTWMSGQVLHLDGGMSSLRSM